MSRWQKTKPNLKTKSGNTRQKGDEEGPAWKCGDKAMLGRRNREPKDKYCVISLMDSKKHNN